LLFVVCVSSTSSSHEQHPLVSPLGNSRSVLISFNVFEWDVPIQYPLSSETLAIARAVSGLMLNFDLVLVFVLTAAAAGEEDVFVENESAYIAVDDRRAGSTLYERIATLRAIKDAAI